MESEQRPLCGMKRLSNCLSCNLTAKNRWFVPWRFTARRRNFSLRRENGLSKLKTQPGNTWEKHLNAPLWSWVGHRCVHEWERSWRKVPHKSPTRVGQSRKQTGPLFLRTSSWVTKYEQEGSTLHSTPSQRKSTVVLILTVNWTNYSLQLLFFVLNVSVTQKEAKETFLWV